MGPKWILARVRSDVAESDYPDLEWQTVILIALRPTQSGTPINRLSAHVAVNILRDFEPASRPTKDYALELLDRAIRYLAKEMQ